MHRLICHYHRNSTGNCTKRRHVSAVTAAFTTVLTTAFILTVKLHALTQKSKVAKKFKFNEHVSMANVGQGQ